MKTIEISGRRGVSKIYAGESVTRVGRYLPPENVIVITDTKVGALYGQHFVHYPTISIGRGEQMKSMDTVAYLIGKLLELGADRSTFILAVGGGVVCDIAGFTASVFMRGVRFGFVPTTLLAQVDAAIGGKNGVNFDGYKNIVGTFRQPEFVLCDPVFLKTLPPAEMSNGLAEMVKHALIADAGMFEMMLAEGENLLEPKNEILHEMMVRSVEIKASVVEKDEREEGGRRKLNFGHTFGHAIEKATGLPHGEAVSIGMVIAVRYAVGKGYLTDDDLMKVKKLLSALQLPVETDGDAERIFEALLMDKKREGGAIHFVTLEKTGRAIVEKLPVEEVLKMKIKAL